MTNHGGYAVRIKRSAEREMDRLPRSALTRIQKSILALERNPRPVGVQKLQGISQYRIRVGDFRVLYTIDDRSLIVEVVAVGHRRDVYRGL